MVNVRASVAFPQAELFGVKLINGHATQSVFSITNNEPSPVKVHILGGSLWTLPGPMSGPSQNIRNLSSAKTNVDIAAGQTESLPYAFASELQPQDLRLLLLAGVTTGDGTQRMLQVFNETVAVVDPESSIFDPQM